MPLTDRDPNVGSGRASSRASYLSADSQKLVSPHQDHLSANPGVISMLRTTTELGDIASLAVNKTRSPAIPRPVAQRSRPSSRLSTSSSSHSCAPRHVPHHQPWSSISSAPRKSMTSSLSVPQYTQNGIPGALSSQDAPTNTSKGGRSFSMTNASQHARAISNPRSYTSLQSNDPVSRPQSPYRYPTRFRRPGYRSPSPAMSDVTGGPGRIGPIKRIRAPTVASQRQDEGIRPPYSQRRNLSAPTVATIHSVHPDIGQRHKPNQAYSDVRTPGRVIGSDHLSTPQTDSNSSGSCPTPSMPCTPQNFHASGNKAHPVYITGVDNSSPESYTQDPNLSYYDYSEHFERVEIGSSPTAPGCALGFVHRIKTVLDKQMHVQIDEPRHAEWPQPSSQREDIRHAMHTRADGQARADESTREEIQIAELPATPLVRPLTRELIHTALSPSSSEPADTTITLTVEIKPVAPLTEGSVDSASMYDRAAASSSATMDCKRQSIISETTSTSLISAPASSAACSRNGTINHGIPRSASLPPDPCNSSVSSSHSPNEEQKANENKGHSLPHIQISDSPATSSPVSSTGDGNLNDSNASSPLHLQTGLKNKPSECLDRKESVSPSLCGTDKDTQSSTETAIQSDGIHRDNSQKSPSSEKLTGTSVKVTSIEVIDSFSVPDTSSSNISPHSSGFSSNATAPTSVSDQANEEKAHEDFDFKRNQDASNTHLVWNSRGAMTAALQDSLDRRGSLQFGELDRNGLRLSNFRYVVPGGYLPDVQEDPHEDSTILGSRSSQRTSRQSCVASLSKFPLPQPLATKAAVEEENSLSKRSSHASSPGQRDSGKMSLNDTRALPSFNFSRMNLFAKMNEAFELRESRSLDGLPSDFQLSPLVEEAHRPASAGSIRERYRSMFASLDEADEGSAEMATDPPELSDPSIRACSPVELLTEVDRLTIPTVSGLTQRLTELLPSLKRHCDHVEEEEVVEEAEQVAQIESEVLESGPKHLNPMRSSARLRPLPGRSSLCVVEDEVYEEIAKKRDSVVGESVANSKRNSCISANSNINIIGDQRVAELEAPVPAHLRPVTPQQEGNIGDGIHLTNHSPVVTSPASSRPWNNDENYPWGDATSLINIKLPAPIHERKSLRIGPSNLCRMSCSSQCSSTEDLTYPTGCDTANTRTTDASNDPFKQPTHKGGKHGELGIPTKSFSLPGAPALDTAGYATRPDILCDDNRPVDPGDRYPTTGLTPPSTFNLEEVRSFFSDDSSQRNRAGTFRKRLTNLRLRVGPAVARAQSAMDSRTADRATVLRPRALTCGNTASCPGPIPGSDMVGDHVSSSPDSLVEAGGSVHTFNGTSGMNRMEFRAKKMLERIKTFWFRSAEMIRGWSMSGAAKRRKMEREEWLRDSDVYSGT